MNAPFPPPFQRSPFMGLSVFALWLVMAASSLVFIEPAPFDIAALGLALGAFVLGLRIPRQAAPMMALLVLTLALGYIGAMNASAPGEAAVHIAKTTYLAITAILLASLFAIDPERYGKAFINGYIIAAIIAVVVALAGIFNLLDGAYDFATNFGRARGTFKDPNVFAPFLIVPALYLMIRSIRSPVPAALLHGALATFLTVGIFVSFSRAAWGGYVVASIIVILMLSATTRNPRTKLRILIMCSIVIAALALAVLAILGNNELGAMFAERFSLTQRYDVGGQGRFANQQIALGAILENPFGLGANEFAKITGLAPHNVYIKAFLMGGWAGGLSYLILVISTVLISITTILRASPHRDLAIVLFASFLVVAIEGLVIDTDHWRQFYLMLGAIWGLHAAMPATRIAAKSPVPAGPCFTRW